MALIIGITGGFGAGSEVADAGAATPQTGAHLHTRG
jgi:hypothetical protein